MISIDSEQSGKRVLFSKDLKTILNILKKTKSTRSINHSHNPSKKENFSTLNDVLDERVNLAIKALNLGGDPKEVCDFLDWREFEHLCVAAFQLFGYETLKGFVFNCKKGRFQIDVLASRSAHTILCIDCKHWCFPYWTSKIKEASKAHLFRTEALAENIDLLNKRLSSKPSGNIIIIPMLLVLGDPIFTFIEEVPIISVLKLKDFLYGLPYPPEIKFRHYTAK